MHDEHPEHMDRMSKKEVQNEELTYFALTESHLSQYDDQKKTILRPAIILY